MVGPNDSSNMASSGVAGLDDVLGGGFQRDRLYLVEGVAGAGKTTLALQFLLAGVARSESVLYITLSETAAELRAVAASHGWTLDGVTVLEFVTSEQTLEPGEQSTMFHPAEVELAETTKRGGPSEGRVPSDSGPRIEKPAVSVAHEFAPAESRWSKKADSATNPCGHAATGQSPHTAGRRSARGIANHAWRDRCRHGTLGACVGARRGNRKQSSIS